MKIMRLSRDCELIQAFPYADMSGDISSVSSSYERFQWFSESFIMFFNDKKIGFFIFLLLHENADL